MSSTSFLFVQINDFYHIDYLLDSANPRSMILPRLATLLTNLRKLETAVRVDRVFFCLPGDFLSPSCLSRYFHGKQMIDLFNQLHLDFAAFGNHEFDFEEKGFQPRHLYQCLDRSQFRWICSNFEFAKSGVPQDFARHPRADEWVELDCNGRVVVLFGLLYKDEKEGEFLPFGRAADPIAACRELIRRAKSHYAPRQPTFIALTHQSLHLDLSLAEACPELRLIMGGHDHDVAKKHFQTRCLIVKAKSNARSIRLSWVVRIPVHEFDSVTERIKAAMASPESGAKHDPRMGFAVSQYIRYALWTGITGEIDPDRAHPMYPLFERYLHNRGVSEGPGVGIQQIGDEYVLVFSVPFDAEISDFVQVFAEDPEVRKAIDAKIAQYPSGSRVIVASPCHLVISDRFVRSGSTNFGNLAADVVRATGAADLGVVNGGSFRLGRDIQRGETITSRTLCEIFFHPNDIRVYRVRGSLVRSMLLQSIDLKRSSEEGNGDFLQISGVVVVALPAQDALIDIGGEPLDPNRLYRVATTCYVATKAKAYESIFDEKERMEGGSGSIRDSVEQALAAGQIPDEIARWRF